MSTVFPGNRPYTLNSLVEELALAERHFRDGSWAECTCNPEKHFPLIAGLASEGYGFASDPQEKMFMKDLGEKAKQIKEQLKTGIGEREADRLRDWTRDKRLAVEALHQGSCPTCVRKGLKAKNAYISSGETSDMAKVIVLPANKLNMKSALTIYGVQWLGKILAKGGEYLDANFPGAVMGYNPSLFYNALWTIGGLVIGTHKKFKGQTQFLAAALGGFVSTEYVDTVLSYVTPQTAGLRYVAYTPRGSPSIAAAVPAQGALGKYT